jgi:hypothetical protein
VKRYWTCPKGCGGRWERALVKCRTEGCEGRRPKKRTARHAVTLRDDSYAVYEQVNAAIHASAHDGEWCPSDCGACGKKPPMMRHNDRDHDHVTGRPRGLLCPGNTGCNVLLVRWVTAPVARSIAETKLAAGELDAARWLALAAYLERVEVWERSRVEGAAV